VKPREAYDAFLGGICDINFIYVGYEPERWALNSVFGQLAIRLPVNENGSRVWDELWNKFPEMRNEFEGVEPLYKVIGAGSTLHHSKKEIRLPKDMAGSRIIVTGFKADFIKECGASPIDLPASEFYMSLERGVADAIMVSWLTFSGRGCSNLARYHTELNMGQNAFCLLMNAKKWASLPEDIQKIIKDNAIWARAQYYDIENNEQITAKEKILALPGHINIVPTENEIDQWLQYAMPAGQKWIEKRESSGKPGKAVFEETLRLSKSVK
jgi:TRAP-type C4-dicarboxylate transport system substrate-binding protein